MRLLHVVWFGVEQVLTCCSNITFDLFPYVSKHLHSISHGSRGHVSNEIIYISN